MIDQGRTAAAADRLLGIQGHETFSYGQSAYEGDACRACTWQGPPSSGAQHAAETKRAAFIAALAEHEATITEPVDIRSHPDFVAVVQEGIRHKARAAEAVATLREVDETVRRLTAAYTDREVQP